MGISVKYDNADNKRPGFKFADYELKGVPVRLVMGGRDLENGTVEVMRRDTLEKETMSVENIEQVVKTLLDEIQANIFQKALKYRQEHTITVDSYDEFKEKIEEGGFILAHWDGTPRRRNVLRKRRKRRFAVSRSMAIRLRVFAWLPENLRLVGFCSPVHIKGLYLVNV